METVNAKDLIYDIDPTVFAEKSGKVKIKFSNGEEVVSYADLYIGGLFIKPLRIFDRERIEARKEFFITTYYNNGEFHNKIVNDVFKAITKYIVLEYYNKNFTFEMLQNLFTEFMEIVNVIFNDVGEYTQQYWESIDVLDLIDFQTDERILNLIKYVYAKPNQQAIKEAYSKMREILLNDSKYNDNPIVSAYRNKILDDRQIDQTFLPRGFTTEMNGKIFPLPVFESFFFGLSNIYSFAAESRSAAKALALSIDAISESEFSARKQQLLAMPIEKFVRTDCGSTDYMEWSISDEKELKKFEGVYRLDENTGKIVVITNKDKHLIGKIIKMRVPHKCKLKNKKHICQVCLSDKFLTYPDYHNLGYLVITKFTNKLTQSTLSAKHLTVSASPNSFSLNKITEKFMTKKKNGYGIKYIPNAILRIKKEEAYGLIDIGKTNIDNIVPERTSNITKIEIIVKNNKDEELMYEIPIQVENRKGYFTKKFLEYINNKGFDADRKCYTVDISKYTSSASIIDLKNIEFSPRDHVSMITSFLETKSTREKGQNLITADYFTAELFNLINKKLDIPISTVGLITYALTTVDPEKGNYDFGRFVKNPVMTNLITAVQRRSAGGYLGFNAAARTIMAPHSFNPNYKPSHPMDVYFMPNEVLKVFKGK